MEICLSMIYTIIRLGKLCKFERKKLLGPLLIDTNSCVSIDNKLFN